MFNIWIYTPQNIFVEQIPESDIINPNSLSFENRGIEDSRFSLEIKCRDREVFDGYIVKIYDCECMQEVFCWVIEKFCYDSCWDVIKYSWNSFLNSILPTIDVWFWGISDVAYIQEIFWVVNNLYGNIFTLDLDFSNQVTLNNMASNDAYSLIKEILLRSDKLLSVQWCTIIYPYTPKDVIVESNQWKYGEDFTRIVNKITFENNNGDSVTLTDQDSIDKYNLRCWEVQTLDTDSDGLAEAALWYLRQFSEKKITASICLYGCRDQIFQWDNLYVNNFCWKFSIQGVTINRISKKWKKTALDANDYESLKDIIQRIT